MKKRLLSLFLGCCMVLALLPTAALAADGGFTIEDGVLTEYNGPGGDVVIPNGVTEIGDWAFKNCTGLTSVTIPNSVTFIGMDSFSGCTGLTSVTIPNGVTYIGDAAFSGCTGLTVVNISGSVTEIWYSAFFDCASLTDIQVSAGNQTYASIDGVLFSKDFKTLERYPAGRKGAYTIPDSVTNIGEEAFSGCTGLTSVTIPGSVTSIEMGAFSGCTGLTAVTIPNSVTSIEGWAFRDCTGLTSMSIPGSVTRTGLGLFYGCTGLTAVTIPDSMTSIAWCTFQGCTGLTAVIIPSGVTGIEYSAFLGCTGLTSVTIPDSVTSIGFGAFYGCTGLKDIYYSGTEAQWRAIEASKWGDFKDDLQNAVIHCNSTGPSQPEQQPVNPTRSGIAYASTQTVLIDGKAVEVHAYALRDANGSDTNYVKLRDVAYALNGTAVQFSVDWNQTAKSIAVTSKSAYNPDGSEMKTPFSGDRAYSVSASPVMLDGRQVELEAILLTDDAGNGYTYFKLRDLGRVLNFNVDWSAEKGLFIETDKPCSPRA